MDGKYKWPLTDEQREFLEAVARIDQHDLRRSGKASEPRKGDAKQPKRQKGGKL